MTEAPAVRPPPVREWAAIFALGLAMVAGAWLLYQLLDVVLLVFLGVTLAAADRKLSVPGNDHA